MKEPLVIQVNQEDEVLGFVPKLKAHQQGILHRAISVLVFNSKGDWMLQKRAGHKYHSGGLWSNTCCSHPYPHEDTKVAAERRLLEEMGISCRLVDMFTYTYRAAFDNGLVEHELDHLFFGICDELPVPDPVEVSDWKFTSKEALMEEMDQHPENFTEWFKLFFPQVVDAFEYYANKVDDKNGKQLI